jgi:hypothetical protein
MLACQLKRSSPSGPAEQPSGGSFVRSSSSCERASKHAAPSQIAENSPRGVRPTPRRDTQPHAPHLPDALEGRHGRCARKLGSGRVRTRCCAGDTGRRGRTQGNVSTAWLRTGARAQHAAGAGRGATPRPHKGGSRAPRRTQPDARPRPRTRASERVRYRAATRKPTLSRMRPGRLESSAEGKRAGSDCGPRLSSSPPSTSLASIYPRARAASGAVAQWLR